MPRSDNAPRAGKMICSDCGVEMNHHADKIDYTMALDKPEMLDAALGGVVQEVHTCSECGQTSLRSAADENRRRTKE
jgi:ribosomal protein S27AE